MTAHRCLCGARLRDIEVPFKGQVCSRTNALPCDTKPPEMMTTDDLAPQRVAAWHRFVSAQEEIAAAALAYADVCFRSALAPRAEPQADGQS